MLTVAVLCCGSRFCVFVLPPSVVSQITKSAERYILRTCAQDINMLISHYFVQDSKTNKELVFNQLTLDMCNNLCTMLVDC